MATPTAQPQSAPPANPGPLKRLIVIALIAIVAALAAAGGTWLYLSRHMAASQPRVHAAPPPLPAQALFFALEPMTVNLLSDDGDTHYLRIGLTLKLQDQATEDYLTRNMPEIRSRILLALSNKHPSDLAPLEGKRALATELAALISQPPEPRGKPLRIDEVLFTDFVIQ